MRKSLDLHQASSTKKRGREPLTPEQRLDLAKVREMNKEIAACASKKDLSKAVELFEKCKESGYSNLHTYSSIMNVYVRCGLLTEAEKIFTDLCNHKKLKIDVVTCTTILNGYSSIGNLYKCLDIFDLMDSSQPKIQPNIRTINTYLRCCLITGAVYEADAMYVRMKDYKLSPDLSTWEYLVTLLCQALMIDKVLPLLGRIPLQGDAVTVSALANMRICLARAHAFLGDWKACRKALRAATDSITIEEQLEDEQMVSASAIDGTLDMDSSNEGDDYGDNGVASRKRKTQTVTGGKKAWKSEKDNSREQSLELYRDHKRAEMRLAVENLKIFVDGSSDTVGTTPTSISQYRKKEDWIKAILPHFQRCFSMHTGSKSESESDLQSDLQSETKSKSEVETCLSTKTLHVNTFMISLLQRFGLATLLNRTYPIVEDTNKNMNEKNKSSKEKNKNKGKGKRKDKNNRNIIMKSENNTNNNNNILDELISSLNLDGMNIWKQFQQNMMNSLDNKGYLNFDKIFNQTQTILPSSQVTDSVSQSKLPMKLEICSGTGEWVVAQAKADKGKANWAALEMRHDRVYQTFTRAAFDTSYSSLKSNNSTPTLGIPNLCVIGGDAMVILPKCIAPESISCICVNHPEPPQQIGAFSSDYKSQGKHLLNNSFFKEISRVLIIGGVIAVLTDNQWYGKLLIRQLANAAMEGQSFGLVSVTSSEGKVADTSGAYTLYKGSPGTSCGHMVEASSYFDRLWKRHQNVDRYFIVLRREGVVNKRTTFAFDSDNDSD